MDLNQAELTGNYPVTVKNNASGTPLRLNLRAETKDAVFNSINTFLEWPK